MRWTRRRTALAATVAATAALTMFAAVAPFPAAAAPRPPLRMFDRDVLTPGEGGSVPTNAYSTDQIPLYSGLTNLEGHVSAADLATYFKEDPIGDRIGRLESTPRHNLSIIRDAYDVPHIFGATRADAEWGAGWVAAEDRGLILQVIRGPGMLAATDAPGIDALGLATGGTNFTPSKQTLAFLHDQVRLANQMGGVGRQVLQDAEHYVDGINAYLRATNSTQAPWTIEDVIGASSLIGAVFGRGGGSQASDSGILAELQQKLGESVGTAVFNDLREAHDPETPTTINANFPYEQTPTGPTPGSAVIDPGSLQSVNALTPRRHMSNALVVGPQRTAAGTSTAVMGPQVGYYYPEILLEMDIHGGDLDARGASFPGTSLYVELGRGPNFAWSATSSGSENVDQFVEKLCNPDGSTPTRQSDHYWYNGKCIAMTTFDAGTLSPGGEVVFKMTVNGPVSGACTIGGAPYAIATKRSTYGRDVVSAVGFEELNDGQVHSAQTFLKAASQIEFTFNWFYVDAHKVAVFSSGRLPVRAPGVNPTLPTYGNGDYEWRGFLTAAQHPHAIDPAGEELINWNNQPAKGWGAASDNWGEGPIDHVLLLSDGVNGDAIQPQNLVSAMNNAATQDPHGALVWPIIDKVLAGEAAPDARTAQAVQLVNAWVAAGSHIVDLNHDGKVDMPGATILNQAWNGIVNAVLSPVLGNLTSIIPGDGDMSYVDKDLRTGFGMPVQGKYSREYCGNGSLSACRASLWATMQAAANALATQDGPNEASWLEPEPVDSFVPGVLPNTMPYTNRPTFQQVVWFGN